MYGRQSGFNPGRDLVTTLARIRTVPYRVPDSARFHRFNRTTPYALHGAGLYNPEEYHRHYNNQSLPSAAAGTVQSGGAGAVGGHLSMLDQSYLSEQPSSLPPLFHHQAAPQAYAPHHPHQLRASTSLAVDRSYHGDAVRQAAGGYYQPRCFSHFLSFPHLKVLYLGIFRLHYFRSVLYCAL